MGLGGASIGWNENEPGATDPAGNGDDVIRSKTSNIRGALDSEHNWPAAGGAAVGYHRYGSARPYVGAASAVSSDGTDGRLMLSSGDTSLWYLSATSSYQLGGFGVALISGTTYGPKYGSTLVVNMGQSSTQTSGTTRVTFDSTYSGVPFILVTSRINGFAAGVNQTGSGTTGFTAFGYNGGTGTAAAVDFNWLSIGTVASGHP